MECIVTTVTVAFIITGVIALSRILKCRQDWSEKQREKCIMSPNNPKPKQNSK